MLHLCFPSFDRRALLAGGLAMAATPALAGSLDALVTAQMMQAGIPGFGRGLREGRGGADRPRLRLR